MKKLIQLVVIVILTGISATSLLASGQYNNDVALQGIKEGKVYFDVNIGEPAKLLVRLQLIDETYNQLVAAGLSPQFVIGIRGKASNFFTKDDGYVLKEDLGTKEKIAARMAQFKKQGFRLEQCKIASDMQQIDAADFLPQIQVVSNGYVSMIGYQTKGYAFVPMD